MQKNYKCNSCGVSFLAEESPSVVCPHCQSDDTEQEKEGSSMKKIVIAGAVAFVFAIGVGMLIGYLKKDNIDRGSFDRPTREVMETTFERDVTEATDVAVAVPDSTETVEVVIPFEDADSLALAEEATVMETPEIAPMEVEDAIARELQRNQQAKEQAQEKAKAKVPAKPQEPVKLPEAEKLTTGQVQALINKVLSTGSASVLLNAKGIAKSVTFDYVDTDGETIPGGVTGLKSGVEMLGFTGYTVVSLGYDSQNKVNRITLRPKR